MRHAIPMVTLAPPPAPTVRIDRDLLEVLLALSVLG